MRVKLLIASDDADYSEHISGYISEHHTDVIDVTVCSSVERLKELLRIQNFDAALLEASQIGGIDLCAIMLPMLLWTDDVCAEVAPAELKKINKYQRISAITASVLENCAIASPYLRDPDTGKARITAVWSPAGGVGKTSVALAFAASKVSENKNVLYLNLESFSSVPVYFSETGKGISAVFEMLENSECNVKMLIQSINRQDRGGISYFCRPDNFDDLNILSVENIGVLTNACAGVSDELIIDLSCACDERTRQVFSIADKVLLVIDQTNMAKNKLSQFVYQHDMFDLIKNKAALVINKSATIDEQITDEVIALPMVQSADPLSVYKTLSNYFG